MDQRPTAGADRGPAPARSAVLERIARSLEKKHALDQLRQVYHERRRTMTDEERAAISDEMQRLRLELAEMEGKARG